MTTPDETDPFGGHESHYESQTDLFRCIRCRADRGERMVTAQTPGQAAREAFGELGADWYPGTPWDKLHKDLRAQWEAGAQAAIDVFLAGDSVSAESIGEALAAQERPAPGSDARRALLDIIAEVDGLDEPGPVADWIRMLAEYGLGEAPHPDLVQHARTCDARPYPAGSEGDDGTVCLLPASHAGEHDDAPEAPARLFACCEHCTHDPDFEPDRHKFPCHQGCDLAHAGAEVTFVAFGNGSVNDLGADAGLSVFRKVTEAGQVMEEQQVAEWTGVDVDGEGGELDTEAAAKQLGYLGWRITGAGWRATNDGQMVIEVESWAGLR